MARIAELYRILQAADPVAWGLREFHVWDPDGNLLRVGVPVAAPGAA